MRTEPTVAAADSEDGITSRRGRRFRRRTALAVAIVAVAVAVATTLLAAVERRLDAIEVRVADPVCVGTKVRTARPSDSARPVPTIAMRQGMRCVLPVRVANGGDHEVHLDRLVLPYLGSGSGLAARVERIGDLRPRGPASGRGRLDAVFDVDTTLPPGRHHDFDIPITFGPTGCSSPRTTIFVSQTPRIVVSTLGRTRRVAPATLGFVGTEDSSCDT